MQPDTCSTNTSTKTNKKIYKRDLQQALVQRRHGTLFACQRQKSANATPLAADASVENRHELPASPRRRVYIFIYTVADLALQHSMFFQLAHFLQPFCLHRTLQVCIQLRVAENQVKCIGERTVSTSMPATRVQQFNAVTRLQLQLQLICYRRQYDKQPTYVCIWVCVLVACVCGGMPFSAQTAL